MRPTAVSEPGTGRESTAGIEQKETYAEIGLEMTLLHVGSTWKFNKQALMSLNVDISKLSQGIQEFM